jgi:hypothetical protein
MGLREGFCIYKYKTEWTLTELKEKFVCISTRKAQVLRSGFKTISGIGFQM